LRRAGKEGVLICLGVAGMLVIAAIVESYLRQSHLSTGARFTFAAGSALFWAMYLFHGAMRERMSHMPAKEPNAPAQP
jgi:threonine/homoserine efflux transporter RhtA